MVSFVYPVIFKAVCVAAIILQTYIHLHLVGFIQPKCWLRTVRKSERLCIFSLFFKQSFWVNLCIEKLKLKAVNDWAPWWFVWTLKDYRHSLRSLSIWSDLGILFKSLKPKLYLWRHLFKLLKEKKDNSKERAGHWKIYFKRCWEMGLARVMM